MKYRCDGLTYRGQFQCTEDVTWSITKRDNQGRELLRGSCGHHLNQVSAFMVRGDDVSQPPTKLEIQRVR